MRPRIDSAVTRTPSMSRPSASVTRSIRASSSTTRPRIPTSYGCFDELGVATQQSDMSFGVSCERTGLEWASGGLSNVFAQPSNVFRPSFRHMIRDILRFNREAVVLAEAGEEKVRSVTISRAPATTGVHPGLCGAHGRRHLVERSRGVPALPGHVVLPLLRNHGLLSTKPSLRWRVISGGRAATSTRCGPASGSHSSGRSRAIGDALRMPASRSCRSRAAPPSTTSSWPPTAIRPWRCSPTPSRSSAGSSSRSATSKTMWCCTPTTPLARRPACLGQLELPDPRGVRAGRTGDL